MEPERIDPRIVMVADAIGEFIASWGFKSIHGRVWTVLALHKGPMAQADIAEFLGVSRPLVSMAMAELAEYSLVRQVSGQRGAPYEARLDVWSTITDVLRQREWMLMERTRLALDSAAAAVRHAPASRWDIDRLELLLSMTELAQTLLRAFIAIRVPQAPDAFSRWLVKSTSLVKRLRPRPR